MASEIDNRRLRRLALIGLLTCMLVLPTGLAQTAQSTSQVPVENRSDPIATVQPTDLRCEFVADPLGVQSPRPRFSWVLDPRSSDLRGLGQTAYRVLVASSPELLSEDKADLWDSGKIPSRDSMQTEYAGNPLNSQVSYYWKVRVWDQAGMASPWSGPAAWTMGLLQPEDWKAHWIAAHQDSPAESQSIRDANAATGEPLPLFRHVFQVEKPIARATVFVSGLGQYELHLNGKNVTTSVLNPGWTNYRKTVLYNSYDVTGLLQPGANAIGVMLGNGMYNMPHTPGRYQKFADTFGQPKLILQMHVTFTDGTATTILSDQSWKVASGPITFSSTYGGEDYDARRERVGWDEAGANANDNNNNAAWAAAVEVAGPGGNLAEQLIPPIRVMRVYRPVKVSEPKPGVLVEDLGQNFSGWPQLSVRGPAGSTVKMIPGELLDSDGLVTQRSSGGPAYFSYTLKGNGVEVWHPRFGYYGFRYIQVETTAPAGSAQPEVLAIEGHFVHSSAPEVGEFATSDQLLDQIHVLINAAMQSNMQSLLTDCPHREKLGWLEETHLLGSALFFNYDLHNLYSKMADDMRDSQLPNGLVPAIAPEYVAFLGKNVDFRDSPEWGSASVISPWIAYQHAGDPGLLAGHYQVMQRYVDYLGGRAHNYMLSYGLGDWYDRGPGPPGYSQLTSRSVTATAIYYDDLTILARVATLLDKGADSKRYRQLARAVRTAFNARLFHPDTNQYDRGSQTASAMPLVLGLVPEEHRQAVLANLVADIRNHENHTTAGDVGFHFVVQALLAGGRSDVVYDMLSRTDSPSYGYQLKMGATTLTEAWDTNPNSSQNHFMLGHAEEWFYRGLAGLDFDLSRAAPEQIMIRPAMVGNVTSASARYDSVLGRIMVSWNRDQKARMLEVTIPPGAVATVYLPSGKLSSITESGRPVGEAPEVHLIRSEEQTAVFRIASGTYHFEWPN